MNIFVIFENETNARALSLENICIVWCLRVCEVVRLTDQCLGFAGWAAVKVACCVTKTGFTQSRFFFFYRIMLHACPQQKHIFGHF